MTQRTYGIVLILLCVLIVVLAAQGTTPEEQDITVVLFLLPLGIYSIFTKRMFYEMKLPDRAVKLNPNFSYKPKPYIPCYCTECRHGDKGTKLCPKRNTGSMTCMASDPIKIKS